MISHGKVRSNVKPENTVIDDYSVWVSSDIKEITVSDIETKEKHIEYEYDLVQYDIKEYILQQANQITDTEIALCEIYESLGV